MVENKENFEEKTILVVDDMELNCNIVKKIFGETHIILTAENGLKAMDILREHSVNIVLLDIQMPVMDGIEAARQIRSLLRKDAKNIPIIAMTANAFAEDIAQTRGAGMNAHLSKPIQVELLYSTLSQLL